MTRTTRIWRSLAVVGAASLVLAACGGDDDNGGDGGDDAAAESDAEPLALGTLLPQTGNLAILGPPEFAGVDLAVQEINEAGGVLGNDVSVSHTDSGDTTTPTATQSTDRLLSEGVSAIIGAASSGVSMTVIDQITQSEVVMFSPANTSPDFTTYDDGGYYFRTAPSDILQGRVMADLLIEDGATSVGILSIDDAYGAGLAGSIEESFTEGGGTVVLNQPYDPAAANYTSDVTALASAQPDAIVIVGFEETWTIVPEMVNQGIGPQDVPVYFVDGNLSNSVELPAGLLDGNKGTLPGAETTEDFQAQLLEVNADLEDFSYAPESYDAAVLIALAATAAGDTTGEAIASELVNVSREGEKCTTYEDCLSLLEDDEDIDYDGQSGPIEFSEAGDVTEATIGIYQYGPDNIYTNVDYRAGSLEE
jgi:branched-chain amino acid transport system substrate-binding protein